MERLKVSDLWNLNNFNDYNTIFGVIADEYSDIVGDFINGDNYNYLDVDYLIGYSADKFLSPLAVKLYEFYLKDIDDITNAIVPIIINRFGSKWKKLWDALNTQYKPLDNYSMLEERTPDITKETTFDTTDERTPDLTKTTNGTGNTTTDGETDIFGFNSTSGNPSSSMTGNQTDTITDRTETETGTDTATKTGTITDTESGKETIERSGNIGVTSSQQMLEQEWQVRQHDFYEMIYRDIDSILCLKTY